MKTIKYILLCIIDCFDALVGKGMNGGITEALIGLSSILVIILTFLISLFVMNRKFDLDYKVNILCSLVSTLLIIFILFAVIAIVEKLFI